MPGHFDHPSQYTGYTPSHRSQGHHGQQVCGFGDGSTAMYAPPPSSNGSGGPVIRFVGDPRPVTLVFVPSGSLQPSMASGQSGPTSLKVPSARDPFAGNGNNGDPSSIPPPIHSQGSQFQGYTEGPGMSHVPISYGPQSYGRSATAGLGPHSFGGDRLGGTAREYYYPDPPSPPASGRGPTNGLSRGPFRYQVGYSPPTSPRVATPHKGSVASSLFEDRPSRDRQNSVFGSGAPLHRDRSPSARSSPAASVTSCTSATRTPRVGSPLTPVTGESDMPRGTEAPPDYPALTRAQSKALEDYLRRKSQHDATVSGRRTEDFEAATGLNPATASFVYHDDVPSADSDDVGVPSSGNRHGSGGHAKGFTRQSSSPRPTHAAGPYSAGKTSDQFKEQLTAIAASLVELAKNC